MDNMMSEEKNKKFTRALFAKSEVVVDLKEAACDSQLIYDDKEIMRIVQEVQKSTDGTNRIG